LERAVAHPFSKQSGAGQKLAEVNQLSQGRGICLREYVPVRQGARIGGRGRMAGVLPAWALD
jgi:hypothetical protein